MRPFTALYDACVLYPAPLRDLLMRLAMTGLFRARWTDRIHEEWMRSVLSNRPDLTRQQLERTRDLMNASTLDCLVSGYESLIGTLRLPDPDDRHVLAAAIHSGAEVIVTYNLNDFPARDLEPFGIEARHPDAFVTHLMDLDDTTVCAAGRMQRASLKNPPKSVDQLLEIFRQQHLAATVARLRERTDLL